MSGLAALRRFATGSRGGGPARPEKCDLCAAPVAAEHEHVLEGGRRLVCACGACARLFPAREDGRYRLVTRRAERLDAILPPALWDQLEVPIGIAFLVPSRSGPARAIYPGAAGAVESTVSPEGWAALVAALPVVSELETDVEALLVDRVSAEPRAFRLSIDLAFELAGVLRRTWRGIGGGDGPRVGLEEFLSRLEAGGGVACPT